MRSFQGTGSHCRAIELLTLRNHRGKTRVGGPSVHLTLNVPELLYPFNVTESKSSTDLPVTSKVRPELTKLFRALQKSREDDIVKLGTRFSHFFLPQHIKDNFSIQAWPIAQDAMSKSRGLKDYGTDRLAAKP